jgi:hypothetical protein
VLNAARYDKCTWLQLDCSMTAHTCTYLYEELTASHTLHHMHTHPICYCRYGDINASNAVETIVVTFIMFFGGLLVPSLIGALGVVMARFHATRPITAFRFVPMRTTSATITTIIITNILLLLLMLLLLVQLFFTQHCCCSFPNTTHHLCTLIS